MVHCNRCKDKNYLIQCKCGRCEDIIFAKDKKGRDRQYANFHHANFKGYRRKLNGYWYIYKPGYFSSYSNHYVREHVYIYQEYYKCCMLPWGDVHHIDENTDNNDISNLMGLLKGSHTVLHKTKDMSDRICFYCGKSNTSHWRKIEENWTCHICWMKIYHKSKRNKK